MLALIPVLLLGLQTVLNLGNKCGVYGASIQSKSPILAAKHYDIIQFYKPNLKFFSDLNCSISFIVGDWENKHYILKLSILKYTFSACPINAGIICPTSYLYI